MHKDDSMGVLLDKYSGMVTEEQIARVIGEKSAVEGALPGNVAERRAKSDARAIIDFMGSGYLAKASAAGEDKKTYYADVEDVVYRIFNMAAFRTKDNREMNLRMIVLGSEGSTVRFVARGPMADYIDARGFERGDRVLIKNALVDMARGELKSISGTLMTRIAESGEACLRVSEINKEMRNVDVVGKVASIYPIRLISKENGSSVAVSRITIADSGNSIDASLWGSSANATASMSANDYVKMEFCNVRERYGRLEIYANDLSRVLVKKGLEPKAEE